MWREHGLPEEDGWFDEAGAPGGDETGGAGAHEGTRIAIVAFPRISNLDEFQPLRRCPGLRLRWARTPRDLDGTDWIVLPGSKHTSGDLAWMKGAGLATAIARHATSGRRVLGICGGLQMLGEALRDPHGVDGDERGLGLLPLETTFARDKLLRRTRARFGQPAAPWSALADLAFEGYEIRQGRTALRPGAGSDTGVALRNEEGEPIGWQRGGTLGVYAHGLFESADVMTRLFGAPHRSLDDVFDGLADFVGARFAPGVLMGLARNW